MGFDLPDDYNDVPTRIRAFRQKHPEGSLQPVDLAKPYTIETLGSETFIVYCAAAYRSPDDLRPGIGIAWEPIPGKTPFTRGSEIQNAETAAWGRAIVATLAADAKRIASDEEIHSARSAQSAPVEDEPWSERAAQLEELLVPLLKASGYPQAWIDAGYPNLRTLREVVAGKFILTHEQYDGMLALLLKGEEEA